jgi:hypothetical protein
MSDSQYYKLDRFLEFPLGYTPSKDFRKFVRAFLAPIYFDSATLLGQQFIAMWAWESANLSKQLNIEEEIGDAHRFAHRHLEYTIPGTSFRLSEVYRTAFMRTLAWFRQLDRIREIDFVRESLRTCPTDLSFWDLESQDLPNWWPEFQCTANESESDPKTPLGIDLQSIRNLVERRTALFGSGLGTIVAAEGSLFPKPEVGNIAAKFSLLGFAYRVHGRSLPEEDEVAQFLRWKSVWYVDPQGDFSIKVLEGAQARELVCMDRQWALGDLEVIPMVSRFSMPTINIWQWFRGYDLPFGLSPFLYREDVSMRTTTDSLIYESNGMQVATCYDWRVGTLERDEKFAYPLHGQAVEARTDWLQRLLQDGNFRLAHALRTEVRVREHSYSEAKEYVHTELLNLGRVVANDSN